MQTVERTRERTALKLEASGRITPREVLEAYRETGLEPATNSWGEPGVSACALSALGVASGLKYGSLANVGRAFWMSRPGAEREYANGFVRGFDGVAYPGWNEETRKGWRDGVRVRKFVVGA